MIISIIWFIDLSEWLCNFGWRIDCVFFGMENTAFNLLDLQIISHGHTVGPLNNVL